MSGEREGHSGAGGPGRAPSSPSLPSQRRGVDEVFAPCGLPAQSDSVARSPTTLETTSQAQKTQ